MTGEEFYAVFKGIRLHFISDGYDYAKYGPSKFTEAEYAKSYTLAGALGRKFTKESLEDRLVGVFRKKTIWINEVNTPESIKLENEFIGNRANFVHNFDRDLRLISEQTDDMMSATLAKGGFDLPLVARLLVNERITLETFCALDKLFGVNETLSSLVWKKEGLRIKKYQTFFTPSVKLIAGIARKYYDK